MILVVGCRSREADATADDAQRFALHADAEMAHMVTDIERFVISNKLEGQKMPLDGERFLDWRRREWWHLKVELASMRLKAWDEIEQLSTDVGHYFGYNVREFPAPLTTFCASSKMLIQSGGT